MTKYPRDLVLKAISGSGGVMNTIAARLKCDWHTAKRYVEKWKETVEAYEAENEKVLDLAESKLYESIQNGNTQDAKWLLSTRGRKRGYVTGAEITGDIKGEMVVKVSVRDSAGTGDE